VIDPVVILAFLPAALALNLTPGAGMMFCLAQGARGGAWPPLAAAAGILAGSMVHVTAAGFGLGALVAQAPRAFDAIRWAGVGYLLWLAPRTLLSPTGGADRPAVRPARAFRGGLVVNLTNPKVNLFILAFVPRFVDPARAVLPQVLVFGAIIALGSFVINGAVGTFSGGLRRALARSARVERVLRAVTATVFSALALRLALEDRR
jgi:threonine/homoserine/homoserine lactone efflux protein